MHVSAVCLVGRGKAPHLTHSLYLEPLHPCHGPRHAGVCLNCHWIRAGTSAWKRHQSVIGSHAHANNYPLSDAQLWAI